MAWVAFDRGDPQRRSSLASRGPVERWRRPRDEIHDEICRHGFNASSAAFTQSYDSDQLDASLLMMPLVGFLPADDPRVPARSRRSSAT